jgi:hypothetical protein
MKPITKTILLLISIPLFNNKITKASTNIASPTDSTAKQREVLLSQQLFVVKLSKPKNKKAKLGIVDMKAELRDAFTIICYGKDKTVTELNWSMCPDGKCPVPGTYNYGSRQYKQLDTLMAQVKQANIKSKKEVVALAKSVGKKTR